MAGSSRREMHWFPTTASYPPLPYIPAALGLLIGRVGHFSLLSDMLAGRLSNLIIYLTLVAGVVFLLPYGRLCILAALTTPTALSLAASFSADPISIALPMMFTAICLRSALSPTRNLTRKYTFAIFILGASLGLLKLTCCVVSLVIFTLPSSLFRNRITALCYRVSVVASSCALGLEHRRRSKGNITPHPRGATYSRSIFCRYDLGRSQTLVAKWILRFRWWS
jgi:uncharacterized membrane protein